MEGLPKQNAFDKSEIQHTNVAPSKARRPAAEVSTRAWLFKISGLNANSKIELPCCLVCHFLDLEVTEYQMGIYCQIFRLLGKEDTLQGGRYKIKSDDSGVPLLTKTSLPMHDHGLAHFLTISCFSLS